MTTNGLAARFLLSAAVAVAAPAPATAGGTTALPALERAKAAAKQWQADAVATNVSTLKANPDGTAESWSFLFYSPKTKKACAVDVRGGKAQTLEVSPQSTDPVGEFMDSDRAMQEAKKNGLKGAGPLTMAVLWMGGTKRPGAFWTVGAGFSRGDVSVVLEGTSGKLVTTHAIE